jgi:acyl-coenzyme A thioesterase PaaI-like protein
MAISTQKIENLMSNRLSNMVKKINHAPKGIRPWLLTKLFCSQVKYANTTGIHILSIEANRVEIEIANKKKVQNHIGGVHAIAAALMVESATGIAFGINLDDSKLPLLKSMTMDFNRRMQGALKAVATITDEQIAELQNNEKGDMLISVVVTDESNESPIECLMNWAWVNKKR